MRELRATVNELRSERYEFAHHREANREIAESQELELTYYAIDVVVAIFPIALVLLGLWEFAADASRFGRILQRGDLLVAGMAIAFVTALGYVRRPLPGRTMRILVATALVALGTIQGSLYAITAGMEDYFYLPHARQLGQISVVLLGATIIVGMFGAIPWHLSPRLRRRLWTLRKRPKAAGAPNSDRR